MADEETDALVQRVLDEGVAKELRDHGTLLPPWIRHPEIPRHAIGWRMGSGESFLMCWFHWAAGQPWEQLVTYFRRYAPVPVEWADWVAAELDSASRADSGGVAELVDEDETFGVGVEEYDPTPAVKRIASLGIVDFDAWRVYWATDA